MAWRVSAGLPNRFTAFALMNSRDCFYVHREEEAVRHLFRVAAGLDSLIVGEPQVLGQVKQAYFLAKEAETCGNALESVFHRVFNTAKRVRTETHVAEAPVSVSSAAVELAEQAFGGLQDKTVMIIGAGQMGELAARHLVAKGVSTVLVSNRTHAHAVALAQELRGLAIQFSEIWQAMRDADIVISSTGCPHFIITRDDMERLMPERNGRPIFLIDIAVPRDVDPAVREVAGCTLVNIDGLEEVTHHNLLERQKAMEAADQILNEEIELFRERQEQLERRAHHRFPAAARGRNSPGGNEAHAAHVRRAHAGAGAGAGSLDAWAGEQNSPYALHRTEAGRPAPRPLGIHRRRPHHLPSARGSQLPR